MTNKEKAIEIAQLCEHCIESNGNPCPGCMECERRGIYYGAKEMAEWKDKHYTDILEEESNTYYKSEFCAGEKEMEQNPSDELIMHKTFEEVVEFDKNLKKDGDCNYIYTCPSLFPFAIEFREYNKIMYVQKWQKTEDSWEIIGGISENISINASIDKNWEGFELRWETKAK